MKRQSRQVTAVIPNWNGLDYLKIVMPSLRGQTETNFAVIVVDNGSTDGSVAYLRRHWPDVTVITLPRNVGFAPAINRGIAAADSEFIALLNNDLELDRDWLRQLLAALRAHPEAGMAGGKLLRYARRQIFDGTAEVVSWYGTFTKRGDGETDRGQYDHGEWVFGPNTAAALYRQTVFNRIGVLDAGFFAYAEDTDLHFRAQLAGFRAWYEPEARAYHMVSATGGQDPSRFARYLINRNRLLLIWKNYPWRRIVSWPVTAFSLKILAGAVRDRWLLTLLRAWGAALLRAPRTLLWQRRQVQRYRRVSRAYLNSIVSSELPVPSKILGRRAAAKGSASKR